MKNSRNSVQFYICMPQLRQFNLLGHLKNTLLVTKKKIRKPPIIHNPLISLIDVSTEEIIIVFVLAAVVAPARLTLGGNEENGRKKIPRALTYKLH